MSVPMPVGFTAEDFFDVTQLIQNTFHADDFGHGERVAESYAADAELAFLGLQVDVPHVGAHSGGRETIAAMANHHFIATRGAAGTGPGCR